MAPSTRSSTGSTIRRGAIVIALIVALLAAVAPLWMLSPPDLDARAALLMVSAGTDQGTVTDAQFARAQAATRLAEERLDGDGLPVQVLVARDEHGCFALTVTDGRATGAPTPTDRAVCDDAFAND